MPLVTTANPAPSASAMSARNAPMTNSAETVRFATKILAVAKFPMVHVGMTKTVQTKANLCAVPIMFVSPPQPNAVLIPLVLINPRFA